METNVKSKYNLKTKKMPQRKKLGTGWRVFRNALNQTIATFGKPRTEVKAQPVYIINQNK